MNTIPNGTVVKLGCQEIWTGSVLVMNKATFTGKQINDTFLMHRANGQNILFEGLLTTSSVHSYTQCL